MKTLQYWGTGNFQEHPYTGRIVTWTEKEKQTVEDTIATKLLAANAGFVLDNDETGEVVTSSINSSTGGISFSVNGSKLFGEELKPTGNDQASEIEQFINDTAGSHQTFLAGGDFIIGSPITLHSRKNYGPKWGNKGVGLSVIGCGIENTRIFYTGSKASPAILVTDPGSTDPAINERNIIGQFAHFSLLSATAGGVEQNAGTVEGSAIEVRPAGATTGTVGHHVWFKDLRLDGWQYGISLDDCTGARFERCWFQEFENAIRLGYNADIIEILYCLFGLEQFSVGNERNSAIAVKTGWDTAAWDGGNGNNIVLRLNWMIGIGKGIDIGANEGQIVLENNYFERVRQYYDANTFTVGRLSVANNTFSQPNVNDSAEFKIDLGSAGNNNVELRGNYAPTGTPTSAFVGFTGYNNRIVLSQNVLQGAHLKYNDGVNPRTVTLPNLAKGEHAFGGTYGVAQIVGEPRSTTRGTTGTITCNWYDGEINDFPAMTGNLTINMAGSATPPAVGQRIKFRIKAAAASPESYTVTLDSSWRVPFTFAQPGAGDANKQTLVEVERVSNGWMVVSPQNVWL